MILRKLMTADEARLVLGAEVLRLHHIERAEVRGIALLFMWEQGELAQVRVEVDVNQPEKIPS